MRRLLHFAISSCSWIRRRGSDPNFHDGENLYRAIDPKDTGVGDDGVRSPNLTAIRFPNLSVNRSKYSLPSSVLVGKYRHHESWKFAVSDVPEDFEFSVTEKGRRGEVDIFSFAVVHDPNCTNYSHSEIRAFRNGDPHDHERPRQVKWWFREKLRSRMEPSR